MENIKSRYYTVKQIQKLENCGRDKAYELVKLLPHEVRGRELMVFAEEYEKYYQEKRTRALERKCKNLTAERKIYQIRKIN